MKNSRLVLSLLLGLGFLFNNSALAQCVELGTPVGELTPILKSTAAVCGPAAQATAVCDCPPGFVAVGYEGEEGNSWGAMVLSQFTLRCRQLNTDGTLGATVSVTCSNGTAAGNSFDGPIDAAGGEALVGFEVRIGCAIDGVQGQSKPIADIAAGTPNSTSNTMASIGGMGGSAQPIMYAPDGNVIVGMQSYEDPGNNISGGVAWRYAPIETCIINGCNITSIAFNNASACNDNGTDDIAYDDFFTADVVVSFVDAPTTGTLDLSGPNVSESVAVGSIGANSYTFTGLQMPATGGSIFLTASFSDNGTCSLNDNAGISPSTCSPNATGIPTMSEWGLILFALIMLTLSVVFGTQYQQSMAMANGVSVSSGRSSRLPFDSKTFFQILPWVYATFVLVFAIAIFIFAYEMTTADIPGSLIAGGIITYLIHFIKRHSNK